MRYGMGDVYKEVHDLLVPGVIPKGAGHGFKCKPVTRKYAFEVEDVPRVRKERGVVCGLLAMHGSIPTRLDSTRRHTHRDLCRQEETEYLKVVYAATYGLPSPERCEAGGRFFERIFGSR